MTDKKSISEFSDRELLELLLSNQVQIFRKINELEIKISGQKDSGQGQVWISFKKLYENHSELIRMTNNYLANKDGYDEFYNAETDGNG